ncbi:MAG TPA: DHA2 family efflux MFS transporter permease subunit [Chthoniobacterales bacterium]
MESEMDQTGHDECVERMTSRCWIAVLGTMLGAFMAVLDIQITNSSLREIAGGISATPDEASWISTAYLVGEIVTIPLTVWLSRIFGLRAYLLGNICLFLLFSALCGLSRSLGEMIAFRAGQGLTGGVFIPMALTVILSKMPRSLHAVGQAMFGMTATLAPAVGPALGGWLTDRFGWQWNFFVNFLPGALMFPAVWVGLDAEPARLAGLRKGDWTGIGCMAVGLGSLVSMLEEGQRKDWFGSTFILTCGILAAVFVPLFIINEVVRRDPLVNLRLLRNRNLALSSFVAFGLGLGLYGSIYLIPLYLGVVQGYSPLQIGETLIWVGLPQLFIFPVLPWFMKRFDLRLLVSFGCLLFAASCFMNTHMNADAGRDQFIAANIVRAVGQPFTIVPVVALATTGLPRNASGDGSAIFNIFRNIGGSVGIALLSTLVTQREQFHDWRIGERVTAYSLAAHDRLGSLQSLFVSKGADASDAMRQALETVKQVVRKEANIMAFNDAFLFVAVSLLLSAALVWICRRARAH